MAYKLFKTRNLKILNGKAEKIECLSKLSVDNIVKPQLEVYDNGMLCGYLMDYIDGANNLFMMTKWSKMYDDNAYLDLFYNEIELISDLLKEIHNSKYKLVVGDFNASNIIFDKEKIKMTSKYQQF